MQMISKHLHPPIFVVYSDPLPSAGKFRESYLGDNHLHSDPGQFIISHHFSEIYQQTKSRIWSLIRQHIKSTCFCNSKKVVGSFTVLFRYYNIFCHCIDFVRECSINYYISTIFNILTPHCISEIREGLGPHIPHYFADVILVHIMHVWNIFADYFWRYIMIVLWTKSHKQA